MKTSSVLSTKKVVFSIRSSSGGGRSKGKEELREKVEKVCRFKNRKERDEAREEKTKFAQSMGGKGVLKERARSE